MLLCIIDTGIFAFITYKYELCSVFQLGFEKDRVQLADGGHFYVWTTMFSLRAPQHKYCRVCKTLEDQFIPTNP